MMAALNGVFLTRAMASLGETDSQYSSKHGEVHCNSNTMKTGALWYVRLKDSSMSATEVG